jgi:hypothetical protein
MARPKDDYSDPREALMISLYQLHLAGDGLDSAQGHKLAGNIGREMFDRAASEMRRLGLAGLVGDKYAITDAGVGFVEQRFDRQPTGDGLFTFAHKPESMALPPMGTALQEEVHSSQRAMKIFSLWCGLAFVALVLGLVIYA